MIPSTDSTRATETSLTRDLVNLGRYYLGRYLGGRRGLIIMAVAALVIGGALNWSWLVAVGIAPLLIAIAPCAVMCALGLCMSRTGGQSCSTQSSSAREDADVQRPSAPRQRGIPARPAVGARDRIVVAAADWQALDGDERVAAPTQAQRETKSERS